MPAFLAFLFAYALSQFFRSFFAVIAPELALRLHLTAADLGAISAAWFWTFALSQFGVGWALDRIGPRRTLPILMLAAAGGAGLFAAASSAVDCLVANALIGLGCSPIYMGALYVFGRTAAPERFAYLSAMLLGFGSSGNLIASVPLAAAVEAIEWRATFLVIAGLTLLSALLIAALVVDPPRVAGPKDARRSMIADLASIACMPALLPLIPITLVSYAVILAERGLWAGPYLAAVHELSGLALGNAVLAMAVAMTLGAFAYAAIDRAAGRHKPVVAGGTMVTVALFAALALWPDPSVTVSVVLLSAAGAAAITYTSLIAHARSFFPEHLLGRGITFVNFLFFVGAGLLQPASGLLVASLEGAGHPPAVVFGTLHLIFAALLAASLAVYLRSESR